MNSFSEILKKVGGWFCRVQVNPQRQTEACTELARFGDLRAWEQAEISGLPSDKEMGLGCRGA